MTDAEETSSPSENASQQTFDHRVCLAWGGGCDDLTVTVKENRVVAISPSCEPSKRWFRLGDYFQPEVEGCFYQGTLIERAEAIEVAARLLSDAKSPLIYGLEQATCEAQQAAVELADRVRGTIDFPNTSKSLSNVLAFQKTGKVSATLGEIKQRADCIIYWNCDPVATQPHHLSRYSLDSNPNLSRRYFIVDHEENKTSSRAEKTFKVHKNSHLAAVQTLRALEKNRPLSKELVQQTTGNSLEEWKKLQQAIHDSNFVAILFPGHLSSEDECQIFYTALRRWIRELNKVTSVIGLTLGEPDNPVGAENILASSSGYPLAVSYHLGYPRYNPIEFNSEQQAVNQEIDCLLIAGTSLTQEDCQAIQTHYKGIPKIVLSPFPYHASQPELFLSIRDLATAETGLVYRSDGVPLPLRAVCTSNNPPLQETLEAIISHLK
ncbi:Hypothetical protein PBC10988_18430 [Planctomycetales bacterium 10988]|nr:Hypothetical protein PBC10988_18430 [Planctomycetales bacterium 10988]